MDKRLAQEHVESRGLAARLGFGRCEAAAGDENGMVKLRVFAQPGRQRKAVQARHQQVADDNVWTEFKRGIEGKSGVVDPIRGMPATTHPKANQKREVLVVINEK